MKRLALFAACLPLVVGAASAQERFALWQDGAPGFEARASIPEISQYYWTKHVNNPSVTAYLPDPAKANGTAALVVPGGGHALLVTTTLLRDRHETEDHHHRQFRRRHPAPRTAGPPPPGKR